MTVVVLLPIIAIVVVGVFVLIFVGIKSIK